MNGSLSTFWFIFRERSILTLGAISQGCYEQLKPQMQTLSNFLISELQHPNKMIRAITCWTLSRYSKFILLDNLSDFSEELFRDFLTAILRRLLDNEPIVQEAACTTLFIMVETNSKKQEPYLYDIFSIIVKAFELYKEETITSL